MAVRAASRSASRCSATRSGSRSTSSGRSRRGTAATGRRSSARSTRSASSGAPPRGPHGQRVLGGAAARGDGRARRGAPGRAQVRRGHRRRGAGLRRLLVDARAPVAARRGAGRSLRLLRREPADLRALRSSAGAARAARARPQPPQHQADPRVLRTAGAQPDVLARWRRSGRPVRRADPGRRASRRPTTRSTRCSTPAGSRGNVALLTTGHRHPVQVERTDFHDQEGYWRTYWDDDVFYGHVLGCKGLERRAVVLCLNEDGSRDRARERLYVGMSRATDELVVVGDPDTVRRVAGEDVARRLGL